MKKVICLILLLGCLFTASPAYSQEKSLISQTFIDLNNLNWRPFLKKNHYLLEKVFSEKWEETGINLQLSWKNKNDCQLFDSRAGWRINFYNYPARSGELAIILKRDGEGYSIFYSDQNGNNMWLKENARGKIKLYSPFWENINFVSMNEEEFLNFQNDILKIFLILE